MRLTIVLLSAVVLAAVVSAKALPTSSGARTQEPETGDTGLPVDEEIPTEDERQSPEELEETDEVGEEYVDEGKESGKSDTEEEDSEEGEEAEVDEVTEENSDEDSVEESVVAASNVFVIESAFFTIDVKDSSRKSSDEEENPTQAEAAKNQDSENLPSINVPVKTEPKVLVISDPEEIDVTLNLSSGGSGPFAKSDVEPSSEENTEDPDSLPKKEDEKFVSESTPAEETEDISATDESISDEAGKSDLEMASSEGKKNVIRKREEPTAVVVTEASPEIRGTETNDADIEENGSGDTASEVDETTRSSTRKRRTAKVDGSADLGETPLINDTRIRTPLEFFGYYEGDISTPVASEDD